MYSSSIIYSGAVIETDTLTYTGEILTPTYSVNYHGNELTEGVDYMVEIPEISKCGEHTLTFKGIGDYVGTTTAEVLVDCNHNFEKSFCTICYAYCGHSFSDGICIVCGIDEESAKPVTTTTTTTTTATTTTTVKTTSKPAVTTVKTTTATVQNPTKPTETTVNYGDVNNDGSIDALDASAILTEYAKVATNSGSDFNAEQNKAADVNNDGSIDALDASAVLGYYAYKATGGTDSLEKFLNK